MKVMEKSWFYINMYARTGSGNVPFQVLSNTDKRKKMADHEVVYRVL